MRVSWDRVIGGALLLEVLLFAVLLPIQQVVSTTAFLVAVPIGAFVGGYLVTWLLLRKIAASVWLNAMLLGTFATMIYLAIVVPSPGGLPAAIALYGTPLFVLSNAMRIAGCLAAAFHILRRRAVTGATSARII
jgi:hypothetical protein